MIDVGNEHEIGVATCQLRWVLVVFTSLSKVIYISSNRHGVDECEKNNSTDITVLTIID